MIGGSAFGDRLENDRAFAQGVLAELGFPVAPGSSSPTRAAATAFLAEHPGRYVLKFNGPACAAPTTMSAVLADGRDVRAVPRAGCAPARGSGRASS